MTAIMHDGQRPGVKGTIERVDDMYKVRPLRTFMVGLRQLDGLRTLLHDSVGYALVDMGSRAAQAG